MTNLSVEGIEERLGKATPGPWSVQFEEDGISQYPVAVQEATGDRRRVAVFDDDYGTNQGLDADFIANAPSDIRYLLDRIKELTQALENDVAEAEAVLELSGDYLTPYLRAHFTAIRNRGRQALTSSPLKGRDDE